MIYVIGPGYGAPGIVANTYLEGTYSELDPNISQNEEGLKKLFTQFSFPGGIPSHVAPETPGSSMKAANRRSLVHISRRFRYPDLIVACRGRWRGGDWPTGHQLTIEQISDPIHDGAGAAHLALERLQNFRPHRIGRIPMTIWKRFSAATVISHISFRVTIPGRCTNSWQLHSTRWSPI